MLQFAGACADAVGTTAAVVSQGQWPTLCKSQDCDDSVFVRESVETERGEESNGYFEEREGYLL
jgi:hypothetical protein